MNEEKRTGLILLAILLAVSLLFTGLVAAHSYRTADPDSALNTQYYEIVGQDQRITPAQRWMLALSDGFFTVGAVLAGVGVLTWVSSTGFFDMLFYGFHGLKTMVMPFKAPKKPLPFYDYKVERAAKRKKRPNMALMVGLAYLALATLFTVLFYAF